MVKYNKSLFHLGLRFEDYDSWEEECSKHVLKGKPSSDVISDGRKKICFCYTLYDMFGGFLDVPTWGPWGKTRGQLSKIFMAVITPLEAYFSMILPELC